MANADEIRPKDVPPTIDAFRTGDKMLVDGPFGSAIMEASKLLELTAQNALAGNVAPEFVPNSTTTIARQPYVYNCLLYVAKENGYQGPWNANKFTRVDVGELLFKESDSAQFVPMTLSLTGDIVYDAVGDTIEGDAYIKSFDGDFFLTVPEAYVTGIAARFAIIDIGHWEADGTFVDDVILKTADMQNNLGNIIKSNNKGYGTRLYIRHQRGETLTVKVNYLQFFDDAGVSAFARIAGEPGDVIRHKNAVKLIGQGQSYPSGIENAEVIPNGLKEFISNGAPSTISIPGKLVESGGSLTGNPSIMNLSGSFALKVPAYWITKNIQRTWSVLSVGHYLADGSKVYDFDFKAGDSNSYRYIKHYEGCWVSATDKGYGTFIFVRAEEGTSVSFDVIVQTKAKNEFGLYSDAKKFSNGQLVNVDGALAKCSVTGTGSDAKFVKSSNVFALMTGTALMWNYTGNYTYDSGTSKYSNGVGVKRVFNGDIVVNIPEQWWTTSDFPNSWAMISIGRNNVDGTSSELFKVTNNQKDLLGMTVEVTDGGYGTYVYLRQKNGETVSVPILVREHKDQPFTRLRYGHWNIGHFAMGASDTPTITPEEKDEKILAYRTLINNLALDVLGVCEDDDRFCVSDGTTSLDAIYGCFNGYQRGSRSGTRMESLYYSGIKVLSKSTSLLSDDRAVDVVGVVGGKVVHFVEVHLTWNDYAVRTAQIKTLVDTFKDHEYVVITGDFNIGPTNGGPDPEVEMKPFLDNGYRMAIMDYMPRTATYPDTSSCIDNIVVKGFSIAGVKVVQESSLLSDHYLVMADLIANPK